jgi:hypothetical protein
VQASQNSVLADLGCDPMVVRAKLTFNRDRAAAFATAQMRGTESALSHA